jgi:hypothetical protein
MRSSLFYLVKPLVPRPLQLALRRRRVRRLLPHVAGMWPIDLAAGTPPLGWRGWPDNKKFALVLTHDVDTQKGHDASISLMRLEKNAEFVSSFNFVPERYVVSPEVQHLLRNNGFEIGVHGLKHDGKLFNSKMSFDRQAIKINGYLKKWGAVGFRAPSMIRNLEWIKSLNIEYDASTFDTDPFEPQPEGMGTIFPFWVEGGMGKKGYVELPYTLCQDFTLFILLRDKNISVWRKKLDWIAEKGGMAIINTHPDYMNFGNGPCGPEEYPAANYGDFLGYVRQKYAGEFWHVLPKDLARFWRHRPWRTGSAKVFATAGYAIQSTSTSIAG